MTEKRIPDPTLMARLVLSIKGVEWAASLLQAHQHETPADGGWTPHQHVAHLLATELEVHRARLKAMLAEEGPVFADWDQEAHMRAEYLPEGDITELAGRLLAEREQTVEILKPLSYEQWARPGTWPDGRVVDVAWVAERTLRHGLEHFVELLTLHETFEPRHAPSWKE